MKTLRLLVPQWQGGNNPLYFLGAELLSWLAPKNEDQKEIRIAIDAPDGRSLEKENGVVAQSIVRENGRKIAEVIEQEQPDKIITFGGDCLVSQAPFDYLKGKYQEKIGIIWIDSHPDISTPEMFYHEHAMVLGNLLGKGDQALSCEVKNQYTAEEILFVGLQEPSAQEKAELESLKLNYVVQAQERLSVETIQEWLTENQLDKVAIHLDLDVLDPAEFRSLYFAEPGRTDFPSEGGRMSLKELAETMTGIAQSSEIVGLTIAEHLPWDAANLKQLLGQFSIFE